MVDKKMVVAVLRELGLKTGDTVLLHSSLVSIGGVAGGPGTVIDGFLEVLGESGTLLAPTFGALGVIPELLRQRPGAVISPCPVGTVVALGAAAEELCRNHWVPESPHAEDTPYFRLADRGGYICLLGVDQDRNTFLHGVEAALKLPYLGEVSAEFTTPDGVQHTKTWRHYPGPHRNFIGLDHAIESAGIMRRARLGNAEVRLIDAAGLRSEALRLGAADPAFVLCDNPACADCVRQRAAIYAAAMSRESFQLAASARLAGRYVPEMVENLQAAGISRIELDYLAGKNIAMHPPQQLRRAVDELREAGIEITGVRLPAVPAELPELLDTLKKLAVNRLIIPLTATAEPVTAIRAAGVEPVFCNTAQGGLAAAAALRTLTPEGNGNFCFNPAAFAAAGEMPFLRSYKVGRFIRSMVQLDINDARWDGTSTRLAAGNAEIKELISISRCRNFSGYFVLGGGAVYPGSLAEAAADFARLLREM